MKRHLDRIWSCSGAFRVILIVALLYAVLQMGLFLYYWYEWLPGELGQPAPVIPYDLQIYLDAAKDFLTQQNLYPERVQQVETDWYEYPPSYAMAFSLFLQIPPSLLILADIVLHFIAYALLYLRWGQIFRRSGLCRAEETLAWILPLWISCTAFWFDMLYLNNYVLMALLATLLIEAILDNRLGQSLLWLSIILQIKPQWAFAAALPLFLGQWRFFAKLLALAITVYVAAAGVTILAGGPAYGWQQYENYFLQLWHYHDIFPWRGPEAKYLGYYGHGIVQVLYFLLGVTPSIGRLALGLKVLILLPLAGLLSRTAHRGDRNISQRGIDLAFALYLGTFIWLDVVTELSLGIAVFTYLLATLQRREAKILIWVIFLLYALSNLGELAGYAIFGESVISPEGDIMTNPNVHVPTIMITILTFYAMLLRRLWASQSARQEEPSHGS